MKEQGLTHREIAEELGFTKEQVKRFVKCYHEKERRVAAGIALKKKVDFPRIVLKNIFKYVRKWDLRILLRFLPIR